MALEKKFSVPAMSSGGMGAGRFRYSNHILPSQSINQNKEFHTHTHTHTLLLKCVNKLIFQQQRYIYQVGDILIAPIALICVFSSH